MFKFIFSVRHPLNLQSNYASLTGLPSPNSHGFDNSASRGHDAGLLTAASQQPQHVVRMLDLAAAGASGHQPSGHPAQPSNGFPPR
jgi:hypothetical protein